MVSKVLKVFYGADYLPYKDSERTIHFPVGGNTFAGTQNTFRICFYPRDLVGSNDLVEQTSWVLVSKLPNGKLGYQLLNAINTDSDLGEKYLVFDLSSYYSQYKGVVKLAIRGYQGEISFVEDEDTGTYSVQGTPIIGVTGTIDIAINYSPMVYGEQLLPSELDQLVAMFSEYLTINAYQEGSINRIVVIDSDLVDYSDYDDGQLFYRKDLRKVMQLSSGSLIDYDFGYIASGNYDASKTLEELATMYGLGKTFVLNYTNSNKLICSIVDLGITNQLTYNIFNPYGGVCWQDTLIKTTTLGTIVNGTPNRTFTTKSYVDNAIDTALIGAYKPQGNASVSTLNGLTKSSSMNGYVYNMTDSGNLTNQDSSTTSVLSGDNVVLIWDNGSWHWDNLVGSNYVEKTSSANKVYGTNELGAQTTYTVDDFYEGNIARRDTDGSITVPLTPTQNGHASSKKYVDDEVDTKQDTLVSGTNIKTINNTSLLGSGNIDYDTALNESSTNAVQNLVIAKDIREINYELAVIRESLFETVLTELPYKVNYATEYLIPSTLSDTDGTHRVVYSETQLDYFEGNGFVVNQLLQSKSTETLNGVTCTNNGDGTYTLSGIATADCYFAIVNLGSNIYNHYLLYGVAESSITGVSLMNGNTGVNRSKYAIQQYTSGVIFAVSIYVASGKDLTTPITVKPLLIDLTKWYGGTLPEDLTASEFLSYFGTIIPQYNTGEIKNTNVSGLESVGLNQWDETTFNIGAGVNSTTGETDSTKTNWNSSGFVKVLPNTTYMIYVGKTTIRNVFYYDNQQNYIGFVGDVSSPYTFTTPSNCHYLRFEVNKATYGTTYNHDICINISNASLNGTYLPYQTSSISFTPTELLGALNAHDTLSVVEGNVIEGEQRYDLVKTSNVGSVNLGDLDYVKAELSSGVYRFKATYNPIKPTGTSSVVIKAITPKYLASAGSTSAVLEKDKVIFGYSYDHAIGIRDDAYGNATETEFKNHFTNTDVVQFELDIPTTTTIATDLTFEQVTLLIQEGGTIGVNFTNVPPNVQTKFVVKKAVGE